MHQKTGPEQAGSGVNGPVFLRGWKEVEQFVGGVTNLCYHIGTSHYKMSKLWMNIKRITYLVIIRRCSDHGVLNCIYSYIHFIFYTTEC